MNKATHWLEPSLFAQIVQRTPLVSIDLILVRPDDAVLVGQRTFEPAKGMWFVPGGRIGKMETLDEAFARVLKVETGLESSRDRAKLLGVYEHFYDANRFGDLGYGTHYVVLGYEMRLTSQPKIRLDDQHAEIRWMTRDELLADPEVHTNTKAYFT